MNEQSYYPPGSLGTSEGRPAITTTPVVGEPGTSPTDVADAPGSIQSPPPGPAVHVLRRSRRDHVVGGVCGGLGNYFGVDAVLFRIVAVALALSGGFGVLTYLIAWVVIPQEAEGGEPEHFGASTVNPSTTTLVAGLVLVAVGVLFLVHAVVPWFGANIVWPAVIIASGVVVALSGRGRRS